MRVSQIAWASFRLPYAGQFATAHGAEPAREGVLLRLTLEDGTVGLGEASPVAAFGGGALADVLRLLAECAPAIPGADVAALDDLLAALDLSAPGGSALACALDTAICDALARRARLSLAAWLGGAPAASVAVNATLGAGDAAPAARRAVEQGFGTIKLKVGAGRPEDDIGRIAAARAAIGPGPRLRIDANGAWRPEQALALLRDAARFDLELAEQPVPAGDLAGMAWLRDRSPVPIAADEAAGTAADALRIAGLGAADLLVVKPMQAGGLRPARDLLAIARAAGLRAFVTTTIDAGVGCAAALHLAALLPPGAPACGLATGPLLAGDLLAAPLAARGGRMALPPGPGLGVTLDEDQMRRFGGAWLVVGA